MSLAEQIIARAKQLGFSTAAIVPARIAPNSSLLLDWIHEGRHGLMAYMERYEALRVNPAVLEPGTKTVIALTTLYACGSDVLDNGLRIARYAHNDDYHDIIRARLLELAAFIHAETGAPVAARPTVDSAPLLERSVAADAGLGWIGKNSLLLSRQQGSFTLLSELLVDLEIEAEPLPSAPNRCGSCSRCIDRCPTGAIVSPYIVDARRCISYLTIELKGPIPRELRHLIGDHLFGCDVCQDVCPWNSKAPRSVDPAFMPRKALQNLSLKDLICIGDDEFREIFKGSPMKRSKRRGLLRNAAVVLGNQRDVGLVDLLAQRLLCEPEELVRGHLAWALGRIGGADAAEALKTASERETEVYVQDEIQYALEMM